MTDRFVLRNELLALKIRRYWVMRDYPSIDVRVVPVSVKRVATCGKRYVEKYLMLSSNLGPNGLPPR